MKTMALAAMLAACTSVPALAQTQGDDHSAHQEDAAPAAPQTTQPNCPMGTAIGGGNEGGMHHMAQMQQMMQTMQQMQGQMQTMQTQMMQMQNRMQMGQRQARDTHH